MPVKRSLVYKKAYKEQLAPTRQINTRSKASSSSLSKVRGSVPQQPPVFTLPSEEDIEGPITTMSAPTSPPRSASRRKVIDISDHDESTPAKSRPPTTCTTQIKFSKLKLEGLSLLPSSPKVRLTSSTPPEISDTLKWLDNSAEVLYQERILRRPDFNQPRSDGPPLIPHWHITATNSIGQYAPWEASFDLYSATLLSPKQVHQTHVPLSKLEEDAAHHNISINNILHQLCLRAASFRDDWTRAEAQNKAMQAKLEASLAEVRNVEARRRGSASAEMDQMAAKMLTMQGQLDAKGAEISRLQGRLATELEAHYARGCASGFMDFKTTQDFQEALCKARMEGARAFLASNSFELAAARKVVHAEMEGFERCRAQVERLKGFVEGFDQTQLKPALEGDLQAMFDSGDEAVEEEMDDEFASLVALLVETVAPPTPQGFGFCRLGA